MNFVELLKGKKTYIVSALTVLYGIVAQHQSFSSFAPYLLVGALGATVRAAIAKVELAVSDLFAKVEKVEGKLPSPLAAQAVAVTKKLEAAVDSEESKLNKDVAAK